MGVDVQQEQWIIIKFLVAEGVESADIYFRLSVEFKSEMLSHSTVFEWCARVHSRRQSTDDDIRVEAPRTAIMAQNIRQAETCIIADRRVMAREIAEKLSLSFGSVGDLLCNKSHIWSLTNSSEPQKNHHSEAQEEREKVYSPPVSYTHLTLPTNREV